MMDYKKCCKTCKNKIGEAPNANGGLVYCDDKDKNGNKYLKIKYSYECCKNYDPEVKYFDITFTEEQLFNSSKEELVDIFLKKIEELKCI